MTNPVEEIVGYRGAEVTPDQIDKGLSAGDIDLGYKPKKAYDDAAKEFRVNKAKYYAIIKRNLKEGGAAWTAARRFDDAYDSEGLLNHFDITYKPNTISAMLIIQSILTLQI